MRLQQSSLLVSLLQMSTLLFPSRLFFQGKFDEHVAVNIVVPKWSRSLRGFSIVKHWAQRDCLNFCNSQLVNILCPGALWPDRVGFDCRQDSTACWCPCSDDDQIFSWLKGFRLPQSFIQVSAGPGLITAECVTLYVFSWTVFNL